MAGEFDALGVVEPSISTEKPPDNIGMLAELSSTDFRISGCETHNGEEDHYNAECLDVVSTPADASKNNEVENCILPCSSRPCLETLDLPLDELLGDCNQENEQRDARFVSRPIEEGASGAVEEESDVTTETKDESLDQKVCVEGNVYDLKEGLLEIPCNDLGLCWPANITENSSSRQLEVQQPFEKDVFCGVSPSSAAEPKDNEGNDVSRNSSPPGLPDNAPSISGRSSWVHKSSHKAQPKRPSRKSKNKAKVLDLHIFLGERKRRTCLSKPARSSNWGFLGNIEKYFKHSNELDCYEPSKRKLGQQGRTRNKSRASGSSQVSWEKETTSTSGIRLKVKLGNEVCKSINISEVYYTSAFYTSAFSFVGDFETKSLAGISSDVPSFADGIEHKMHTNVIDKQLQCSDSKLGETKSKSDTSFSDLHLEAKNLEGIGDAVGDCLGLPSHMEIEGSETVFQKGYADPGTSPDSEVINLVPDCQANTGSPESLFDTVLPSEVFASAVISKYKRGKTKDIVSDASDCCPGDISPQSVCASKAKTKNKQGSRKNKDDGTYSSKIITSSTDANASSNSSNGKDLLEELSHMTSKNDIVVPTEAFQSENKLCADLDAGHVLLESQYSNHLLASKKSKGCLLPKKSCAASNRKSKVSGKTGNNRENGPRQRVKERKPVNGKKVKEKNDCGYNYKTEEVDMKTGSCILDDVAKIVSDSNAAVLEATRLDMASGHIAEQHKPVDDAWVQCDDCRKWRRIPVALVDSIKQTNCQWICKDNTDKEYADCSIPQEKSNEDINAELGTPDADEDAYDAPLKSKGLECTRPGFISNEHEFTLISSNQFLHRSRKTQTIDEIMVCHCKLPLDGRLGCGNECLNRMLNIECVQGTCPCGDLCSNQQFQKRNYVKMKWERCGKKGYGLRSEEDISKGRFLIEYVGEVLDMHTYEARQRQYASNSHKHFYFMTLNGSEVIDACAKGNVGRLINHSCDPNCRTEKWVVNGEICIGLFALRDIKKGEEVTFDYNYVRVFGAAAKKCYCGASNCRGCIGGDPTSTEAIDQVDSDEEFLEPVMLEDGKTGHTFKNRKSRSGLLDDELRVAENKSKDKGKTDHPNESEVKVELVSEIQDAVDQCTSDISVVSHSNPSLESDDMKENFPSSCEVVEISETRHDSISKSLSANHKVTIEENQRRETSPSEGTVAKSKSKSSKVQEKRVFIKSRFLIKTSRESSSSKKGKVASNHLILANNSQMLSIKPKKFMHGTTDGRLETVEEKLNELLDDRGGISKRKDAARGYLKFLVHTAASGASGNGEAIQSNRDLSMILDALIKTKSSVVLVDIINKNGLRMLHNMIKQYRKDFKKTPILRKLLKVLAYLAGREVLTQEHINGRPPCPGMESFQDSMLSLTEHDDKQVHQIARNFRDKWIPRHRRHSNAYIDDRRMDFHSNSASRTQNQTRDVAVRPAEAINCTLQPKPATAPVDPPVSKGCSESRANGETKRRERVSRWDQPAPLKPSPIPTECNESKTRSGLGKRTRESYYGGRPEPGSNIPSEFPPGFSPMIVSLTTTNLLKQNDGLKFPAGVVGYQQKRFNSRCSVSYGIPEPIMQKFGTPLDGTKESWAVAPGMPFYPFPPLPPFPSHRKGNQSSAFEDQQPRPDSNPSTSGSNQLENGTRVENEQQPFKRARASQDLGKSYFRQEKWNKANVTCEQRSSFCSQDENCRVDRAGNSINQQNTNLN